MKKKDYFLFDYSILIDIIATNNFINIKSGEKFIIIDTFFVYQNDLVVNHFIFKKMEYFERASTQNEHLFSLIFSLFGSPNYFYQCKRIYHYQDHQASVYFIEYRFTFVRRIHQE